MGRLPLSSTTRECKATAWAREAGLCGHVTKCRQGQRRPLKPPPNPPLPNVPAHPPEWKLPQRRGLARRRCCRATNDDLNWTSPTSQCRRAAATLTTGWHDRRCRRDSRTGCCRYRRRRFPCWAGRRIHDSRCPPVPCTRSRTRRAHRPSRRRCSIFTPLPCAQPRSCRCTR